MINESQSSPGLLSVSSNPEAAISKLRFLGPRPGDWRWPQDIVRRLVVSLVYVSLFVVLHGLTAQSQIFPEVSPWNLSAGLSLGFLLGYGIAYLPAVVVSHMLSSLLQDSPSLMTVPVLMLAFCLSGAYALATIAIRTLSADPWIEITNRRTLLAFIVVTPAVALLASTALFVNLSWAGIVGRQDIIGLILRGSAGNITGIFLLAPVVVLSRRWFGPWLNKVTRAETPGTRHRQLTLKTYVSQIGILTAILAGSLYFMFGFSLADGFWMFCLVSLPLLGAALVFGLDGVASVLAILAFVAISRTEVGYGTNLSHQFIFVVAAVNSMVMGLLETERLRQQFTMNHQTALLESVSFATKQLLGMTDQEKNVNEVLEHLAAEAKLDRICVVENRPDPKDLSYPVLYEISNSKKVLGDEEKERVNVARSRCIRKFAQSLEMDGHLQLRFGDLQEAEQAVMSAAGIQVSLILPIFADGRWWGCLALDQCSSDQLWSKPEIDTFRSTARVLGALLAHTNVEQQFRQFTGSIPAVFWIASPDVLHKTYVSPAYEQIWGRSRGSIQENRRSWMAAIYHDDYEGVLALLENRPHDAYDLEYRVIRPDRSVRWIRDTAFPVLDSRGEVNRIVGIAQDITPQKEAEERLRLSQEQIQASLSEKEVLLKEIHHRVKNNLQVISSLLSLQASQIKDERTSEVFKDSQSRVRAMGLVHERLYQSADLARIDFAGYVRDMTNHLLRSYQTSQRGVILNLDVMRVSFDIDTAIPCALIINELVSNSLKYAFPNGQKGEINIRLGEGDDHRIELRISDNGVGLPTHTSFESTDSLGLSLVHSLTKQLNGEVHYRSNGGAEFDIKFKPVTSETVS